MSRAALVTAMVAAALLWRCATGPRLEPNPPAPGFDAAGSDPRAIAIADAVMARMGGRDAWDATRHLKWNFFGMRRHLWDRSTGDARIEWTSREDGQTYVILMNTHSGRGRAWKGGQEVTDESALAQMLDDGMGAWINDSYWLLMPYKLKDSGVTLSHLGERPMLDGRPAEVLELTFSGVGRTPQNKYRVYVACDSGLVEQWDFFSDRADAEPRFSCPWRDWQKHGRILLSGDRGELRGRPAQLTEIAVYDLLPAAVYADPLASPP